MADKLVTVKTFGDVNEAHMAKSAIEEAGIQCFLENEHSVLMTPHLAGPAGVKLLVKQVDTQRAADVLNALG